MGYLVVEVCQNVCSNLSPDKIERFATEVLKLYPLPTFGEIDMEKVTNHVIREHIDSIICSCDNYQPRDNEKWEFRFCIYRLTLEDAAIETMQSDSEDLPVASHWILPAQEFYGLWENLYYSSNIKQKLLQYIEATMLFSTMGIDSNIISWNKVVLLHGPPGTGKTSLCKALAQKAAIRLGMHFNRGELIEINSHSLFSKWFSESGKLIMKLFSEITFLLEDPTALVCILIDEVESLAHARKACTNGTEPSDSIRAVNALLTELDRIKRHKNVLILTTSNVTEAIDLAFVDRADIKQYIGHPEGKAIRYIYYSCLKELEKKKLLQNSQNLNVEDILLHERYASCGFIMASKIEVLIKTSIGLSGRALRKIPFLASAMLLNGPNMTFDWHLFIPAMIEAVEKYKDDELENKN